MHIRGVICKYTNELDGQRRSVYLPPVSLAAKDAPDVQEQLCAAPHREPLPLWQRTAERHFAPLSNLARCSVRASEDCFCHFSLLRAMGNWFLFEISDFSFRLWVQNIPTHPGREAVSAGPPPRPNHSRCKTVDDLRSSNLGYLGRPADGDKDRYRRFFVWLFK